MEVPRAVPRRRVLESVPAGTTPVELDPISDDVLGVANNHFRSSGDLRIFAAFALGEQLDVARVVTPSLRQIAPTQIRPLTSAAAIGGDPNVAEWLRHPVVVPAAEENAVQAVHGAGTPKEARAVLWVARAPAPAPSGQVVTMRAWSFDATTANQWTDVNLTWDDPLAQGTYAVVGSECVSANALAHRWKFGDDQSFRPGGITQPVHGDRTHVYFYRPGALGVWGTFGAAVMPRLQILSTATSASHWAFLQVVRIA